ncbi:NUDIX hydrolase [Alcaligenaceae bacterium]|nr:NUDIX hydrolase [Alcaligenaceae bacterium]
MWLLTPAGFFSIVQKPSDVAAGTLTVRARVAGDLDNLRNGVLPTLTRTVAGKGTDYAYRATAPREDIVKALGELALQTTYSNFKDEVAKPQGKARAALYHDVWDVLYRLQSAPKAMVAGPVYHPRKDEHGNKVVLKKPSIPTALSAWSDPSSIACIVPDGMSPAQINGVAVASWADAPKSDKGWEALVAQASIVEPAFNAPSGYKRAAGVVLRESDGRVWVVAPSNGFAGYEATFPKGTMDGKSAQATALVEAFEESGLKVRLLRHLVDVKRSQSYTRYFLAERIGGDPADMGWESQAVLLVPIEQLNKVLNNKNDQPIIDALAQL